MNIRPDIPIGELGLTGRLPNVCIRLKLGTVADLVAAQPEHLSALSGVGPGTIAEFTKIQKRLRQRLGRSSIMTVTCPGTKRSGPRMTTPWRR